MGKYNNTPGGYFTDKRHTHNGFPSAGSTNGMVEPEAYKHTPLASPHILTYPDAMRSSH